MERREWMKWAAAGLGMTAVGASRAAAQESAAGSELVDSARPDERSKLTIRDVRTIPTQPAESRLIVVKVETDEPELYGLGCATFTQRARVVETAAQAHRR